MSNRQHGLTLIELIVFIIIVGVGIAGILAVFNVTSQSSADPLRAKQALAVAESLLEEIQLKDFTGAGASRSDWGVNQYAGYATTGVYDISGAAVAGLTDYDVAVAVANPGAAIGGIPTTNIYEITVSVTDTRFGNTYSVTGYKFNY